MAASSWVDCLVSIRFDLDIGPKIESIFPPDAITEEGKMKLLHCAFPDCNPDCGYNFIFYFTMPDCTAAAAQSFSQTVAPPTTGNTVPELYGAAFYRQKHDPKVPRRYVQQVVVLLSHLPYYNVHELILRVVAPRFCQCCPLSPDTGKVPVSSVLSPVPESYFEVDQSYNPQHYTQADVLRDAMLELSQWPSPHPQVRYTVTLLQQALVFLTPAHSLRQSIRATRSSCAAVRKAMTVDERVEFMEVARGNARYRGSSFGNDVLPLFSLLGEQLHHLTYVWELLLRHEPLFILSNTPCVASATAFSIASLILPIQFNGTLRSYFTVQNEDFPRLSRMGKALPFPTNEALIVAGTNPFLLRSFSGWPSLLVVMDRNTAHLVNGSISSSSPAATPAPLEGRHDSVASGASVGRGTPPLLSRASPTSAPPPRVVLLDELRAETPPLPASAASPLPGHHGQGHALANGSFPASPSSVFGINNSTMNSGTFSTSNSSTPARSQPPGTRASHASTAMNGTTMMSPLSTTATVVPFPLHTSAHNPAVVTVVPARNGSNASSGSGGGGIVLSAQVVTPSAMAKAAGLGEVGSKRATGAVSPASVLPTYQADPRAVYTLESSTDGSEGNEVDSPRSSSSSSPPSHPSSSSGRMDSIATVLPVQAAGECTEALLPPAAHHDRVLSNNSSTTPAAFASTSSRRHDSTVVHDSYRNDSSTAASFATTAAAMPAPSSSSVTLFTMDNYKTTVESVNTVDYRKRGGSHQDTSRANLQQRLHNYFDSSMHFLLNHAEQTKMLLQRLEMVSLLDADAQRTSVTLSLNHWQGSPTSVASPSRRGGGVGGGPSFCFEAGTPFSGSSTQPPASPSSMSRATSFFQQPQRHTDPTAVEQGITSCSHFSVADDILRKFFTSLTTEFLTPVTAWYQKVTTPYTAFHLCDRALCDSLLAPASFLDDFAVRHRETAPSMWTQLHSYKTYRVVYERFANGCLFKAYVCQLIDEDLRRQMEGFQVEDWVVRVPSEAERIDLLINLLSAIQRELNETLDPDVLFVTSATSVLASMAVVLHQPHREQFMLMIGELKL